VLERPITVVITLNPSVDTLVEGSIYTDPGAIANVGIVVVSGEVNTALPGIYQISYSVEYNGVITTRSRYVCVVGTLLWVSSPIWKEESYEA